MNPAMAKEPVKLPARPDNIGCSQSVTSKVIESALAVVAMAFRASLRAA